LSPARCPADDPRFATTSARIAHVEELGGELQSTFRARPAADWVATMTRDHIPVAMVNSIADALADPIVDMGNMLEAVLNPATGSPVQFVGNPFKYGGGKPLGYPPRVGEHTEEVLRGVCGYDPGQDRIAGPRRGGRGRSAMKAPRPAPCRPAGGSRRRGEP
jgi:CoA:oxalate CoA-transferase